MCGIAGLVGSGQQDVVATMTSILTHRGPDDQGMWSDPDRKIALGHTRLSIIDLSCAAHQPMPFAAGRYRIVFNGELYNHKDLRRELEATGQRFVSSSDTEVVVAAYAVWGRACLGRLRGMFAFAIWDSRTRTLFLARDRFGVKPLLYVHTRDTFLFASEIKALLGSGLVSREIDPQSFWDYLSVGSVFQPRTILRDVRALLPGHCAELRAETQQLEVSRYWDIYEATALKRKKVAPIRYEDAVIEARRLLEEATRYHLVADVPVGAFLSGGVDSSAVVGLMSRLVDYPIRTYAVGFDRRNSHLNELKWAKIASERFCTDHTEVIVTARDAARVFDRLIDAIDQPSLDGSNTYFVSEATHKGVKVALSGLGGDELFAGYPQFRSYQCSCRAAPKGIPALVKSVGLLSRILPGRLGAPMRNLAAAPISRLTAVRELMTESEKQEATRAGLHRTYKLEPLRARYERLVREDLDAVGQSSYVELTGYLRDTLLRDADVMSMAHSLEVRPVLLDHTFAEFAFALPSYFKLKDGRAKAVFLDAVSDLLPLEILNRPKMGFELPLGDWLRTSLRDRVSHLMSSRIAERIFEPSFLRANRVQLTGERRPLRLWAHVVLLAYAERHRLDISSIS